MEKERKKLEWQMPLYVGDEISDSDTFVREIETGILDRNHYLITKSENPGNQLELFSAVYLKQNIFWNLCPPIIGIAGSKKDAIHLITMIAEECIQVTGNCNIKEFMKNR